MEIDFNREKMTTGFTMYSVSPVNIKFPFQKKECTVFVQIQMTV